MDVLTIILTGFTALAFAVFLLMLVRLFIAVRRRAAVDRAISSIIEATIRRRAALIADNVEQNNQLLGRFRHAGKM